MGIFDIFTGPSFDHNAVAREIAENKAVLIDVRSPMEFESGHARGARNIPLGELDDHEIKKLKERKVYAICQSGGRSLIATKILSDAGIDVTNIPGGTSYWQASGLPMAR